jgi:predicted phage-related endonuclease
MSENEIYTKIRALKELEALIEQAEAEAEEIRDGIKQHMTATEAEEIHVGEYKVRYKTVSSTRFDSAAFKKTHADLYEQYTKRTECRRFTVA